MQKKKNVGLLTRVYIAVDEILAVNCLFSAGSQDPRDKSRHVNVVDDGWVEIS